MQQAEVFHIYHQGEQRGPYSARQVNHLYRCGYIGDETLYWRDGMEQWQPVTEIVERRMRRKRRLRKWSIVLCVLAVLGLFALAFGPATRDRWREMTSGEFTEESAWWRARGLVRENLLAGEEVFFHPRAEAQVALAGKDEARVTLLGDFTDTHGQTAPHSWQLRLRFDPSLRQWTAVPEEHPAPELSAESTAAASQP